MYISVTEFVVALLIFDISVGIVAEYCKGKTAELMSMIFFCLVVVTMIIFFTTFRFGMLLSM